MILKVDSKVFKELFFCVISLAVEIVKKYMNE